MWIHIEYMHRKSSYTYLYEFIEQAADWKVYCFAPPAWAPELVSHGYVAKAEKFLDRFDMEAKKATLFGSAQVRGSKLTVLSW